VAKHLGAAKLDTIFPGYSGQAPIGVL